MKLNSTVLKTPVTNNTQRVARRLLRANGAWVGLRDLERCSTSAAARVRDLRKKEYGGFRVDCESAYALNKTNTKSPSFYRILPSTITQKQLHKLFPTV